MSEQYIATSDELHTFLTTSGVAERFRDGIKNVWTTDTSTPMLVNWLSWRGVVVLHHRLRNSKQGLAGGLPEDLFPEGVAAAAKVIEDSAKRAFGHLRSREGGVTIDVETWYEFALVRNDRPELARRFTDHKGNGYRSLTVELLTQVRLSLPGLEQAMMWLALPMSATFSEWLQSLLLSQSSDFPLGKHSPTFPSYTEARESIGSDAPPSGEHCRHDYVAAMDERSGSIIVSGPLYAPDCFTTSYISGLGDGYDTVAHVIGSVCHTTTLAEYPLADLYNSVLHDICPSRSIM